MLKWVKALFNRHFTVAETAVPGEIKSFLSGVKDVSFGYSEINFFSSGGLMEGQTGYSIDEDGNSLVTGQRGDWKSTWIVIANDDLGDPIFVDTANKNLPFFTAEHGEDYWKAIPVASSLDNFKIIIEGLQKLSVGRQTPVDLEKNPLSKHDLQYFLNMVRNTNRKKAVSYYWEVFLESE